jgi:hypothetical protein
MASVMAIIGLPIAIVPYLYSINHPNPFATIDAFCKIRTYLLQSIAMICRWCLVAACLDRCALTSTNARLREFAKVRIAYRVIALLTIIWLILPVHVFVFFDVRGGGCNALYSIGAALYHSIFSIVFGSVLPVSIMIICAVLIRRNLVLKRQRRLQLTTNQQNNNEDVQRRRDQQVFVMLILQALVFVVTQTPWMLFFFYTAATIYVSNKSIDRIVIEQFIGFTVELIVYLFFVLSFYLYTLASHTFRQELMKLLHCRIRRRWVNAVNRINPSATNEPVRMNTGLTQTRGYSWSKTINKQEALVEIIN